MLACPAERRFARPCLEALEDRCSPATLTLNVTYGLGRNVTLSGDLTDTSHPAGQLITIQGMVNGQVVTDAQGHYSLNATPQYLGTVGARKSDGSSNVATNAITDAAPVLNVLKATEGIDHVWTISGTLTYNRPFDSLTVNFGGVPAHIVGQTTTATSDGAFTLSVRLDGTTQDNGTIWAEALSPWNLVSNRLYATIRQTGT